MLLRVMINENLYLAEHFRTLCEKHGVATYEHPECRPYAYPPLRKVHTHPVVDEKTYAQALHELGHVVLRHSPDQPRAWKELLAWRWARANSIILWTPGMEAFEAWALGTWGMTLNADPAIVVRAFHQAA